MTGPSRPPVEGMRFCAWCQATRPLDHQCIGFGLVQPPLIDDDEMPPPLDHDIDLNGA
jgi:hypothetical protein